MFSVLEPGPRRSLLAALIFFAIGEVALAADAGKPASLSVIGMFMQADIIVKVVMLGLMLASFAAWTLFVAKLIEIARREGEERDGLAAVLLSPDLSVARAQIVDPGCAAASMIDVVVAEQMAPNSDIATLPERATLRLNRIEALFLRRINQGVGILATIGSAAPFVGLFGTVWGIMNSFIGISKAQNINLAVVAPGIAEALLATAIGLVAAIPAVIFFNLLTRKIAAYRAILADTASAITVLMRRGKTGSV